MGRIQIDRHAHLAVQERGGEVTCAGGRLHGQQGGRSRRQNRVQSFEDEPAHARHFTEDAARQRHRNRCVGQRQTASDRGDSRGQFFDTGVDDADRDGVALIGDLSLVSGAGLGQVLVSQDISYIKPLMHGREPVMIDVWITRIGGSSYGIAYVIRDENDVIVAKATSVVACVDESSGRPIRIPERVRAILDPLLQAP